MSGLRTTSAGAIVATAALSAPAGAAIGPVLQQLGEPVPQVPWSAVASTWFLGLLVGLVAWHTWRLVGGIPPWRSLPEPPSARRDADDTTQAGAPGAGGRAPSGSAGPSASGRERSASGREVGVGRRLAPHQAVNRLVLGKAAALAGAVCAGAYVGFALVAASGVERQLDGERVLHALLAALGGLILTAAGVLLERACRTQDPGEPDLA